MPKPRLEVLYEDNHLLVVNKPVGLATQGVAEGTASVITHAKDYLKRKFKKPGNVYLGVVSRLDASVSGVLVLARTSKAAARLMKQFQNADTEKIYWALVERPPVPAEGDLSHWLLKNDRERRVMVVPPRTRGSQQARLSYHTLAKRHGGTLVEVRLHTGRKHQIRVQLSAAHFPILGDRKYGSRTLFTGHGIALHCVRLAIDHPTTQKRLEFRAPPPDNWGVANYIDE